MKTYIVYKNQIQGFEDVSETVKAMEKIAASSVHFLKEEVAKLNLYAANIEVILSRLSLFYHKKTSPLLKRNLSGKRALLIITGDKGLVGGLWHTITNAFLERKNDYQSIVVVGNKGKRLLTQENIETIKSFGQISRPFNTEESEGSNEKFSDLENKREFIDIPQHSEVGLIARYIFDGYKGKEFSSVDVLYPKFINLTEQIPSFITLLPFEFGLAKQAKEGKVPKEFPSRYGDNNINNIGTQKSSLGLPIFEPSRKRIFEWLFERYIGIYFHKIILEEKLSEFSARTVATEHANLKTKELIKKLDLSFRKERRRIITQRQLESFSLHAH